MKGEWDVIKASMFGALVGIGYAFYALGVPVEIAGLMSGMAIGAGFIFAVVAAVRNSYYRRRSN